MDCEVCYNGGVCDTYIGTCICPSGFTGASCETSSDGNHFGRDGQTPCKTGNNDGCKGMLICPPMPQGCACHSGWKGLRCETECEACKYGADCLQDCHCNASECDPSNGCNMNATCNHGYTGIRCLDKNDTTSDVGTTNDCNRPGYCSRCNIYQWTRIVLKRKLQVLQHT
ncbi:multiple epidermal growth factor-like domains protein 10 isoform X2 [Anneissia japonica]|uniref:multiple epidermal growth factor-like domains protein 10 isoform X2 n=1 Tax=Anneissia japonica TaxID=1529436 RepID=UPI0014258C3B|nr:multiple epidermal growth factor-like domains protein 10 isoform X2 [Anneissia japonica]